MVATFTLNDAQIDVIRRGICGRRSAPSMAKELGVSPSTIRRYIKRIREDWRKSALETDKLYTEYYGRIEELYHRNLEAGRLREARECMALLSRFTGAMRPERREVTGEGGGPLQVVINQVPRTHGEGEF